MFTALFFGTLYRIKFTTKNIDVSPEANHKVGYKMPQKQPFIDVL